MSASKRRLSRGGKATLPLQEEELSIDEDLNVQSSSRRNSFARRRQSIGKSTAEETEESIQDQNRIADMYKSIIKMSSENKINAKNSWNLDLINHMDKMIKNDESSHRSGSKGVNFQKASCTLDASIKIYSHRVDDTWSSSYRILENLSRSEHVEDDDIDDDDDDDDNTGVKQKKPTRVGSKSTSNKCHRLNLIKTIEKNVKALNFSDQEHSHAADPMFHKMSQAFDEGGAKGMLMSNLRVSPLSSTIMFSALGKQQHEVTSNVTAAEECSDDVNANVGVQTGSGTCDQDNTRVILSASRDLISRSGFSLDDLLAKSVCSSLSLYRDALDIVPSEQMKFLPFAPLHRVKEEERDNDADGHKEVGDEDDCFEDAGGGFEFDDDNDDDNENDDLGTITAENLAALGGGGKRRESGSSDHMSVYSSASKIQWSSVYDSAGSDSGGSVSSGGGVHSVNDTNPIGFESSSGSMQNTASTAAFLAMHTGATNQWAGAKHWKRSTRKPSQKSSETSNKTESKTKKAPTKSRAKKEKFKFDFANVGEGVSDLIASKFEREKGSKKLDPTIQSAAVVQKGVNQAKEGLFTLPADARLNTKDLCRLFHWSSMIVPPSHTVAGISEAICAPSALSHRYAGVSSDQLLRSQKDNRRVSGVAADTIWVPPFQQDENTQFDVDNDDDDDDNACFDGSPAEFYSDDDGEDGSGHIKPALHTSTGGEGLSIQMAEGLLKAPRKVHKLDIGYAKSSKLVNVKKLKSDLWSRLESDCIDDEGAGGEFSDASQHSSTSPRKELSFQEVVSDIAQEQTQKDASLSFYFICLLHLANEKNLCITDSPSMDDLMISKGAPM